MNAEAAWLWNIVPDPSDASEVQCPECKEWSPLAEWTESEVGCEDCGSHAAMVCPECGEKFDHVHGPVFASRP